MAPAELSGKLSPPTRSSLSLSIRVGQKLGNCCIVLALVVPCRLCPQHFHLAITGRLKDHAPNHPPRRLRAESTHKDCSLPPVSMVVPSHSNLRRRSDTHPLTQCRCLRTVARNLSIRRHCRDLVWPPRRCADHAHLTESRCVPSNPHDLAQSTILPVTSVIFSAAFRNDEISITCVPTAASDCCIGGVDP